MTPLTYVFVMIGGGSSSKINLGMSFYGRSFTNAKGLNEKHGGADLNQWSADDGTPQYCKH